MIYDHYPLRSGFDDHTREFLTSRCVAFDSMPIESSKGLLHFETYSSRQERERTEHIGLAASYKTLLTDASMRATHNATSYYGSTGTSITVAIIKYDTTWLRDDDRPIALTREAVLRLETADGEHAFRDYCGTHFVRAVTYGGVINHQFVATATGSHGSTDFSADVKAAVGPATLNGNIGDLRRFLDSTSKVDVTTEVDGSRSFKYPNDEMSFKDWLAALHIDAPVGMRAQLASYAPYAQTFAGQCQPKNRELCRRRLSGLERDEPDVLRQRIDSLAELFDRIDDFRANPRAYFTRVGDSDIERWRAIVLQEIRSLAPAVAACTVDRGVTPAQQSCEALQGRLGASRGLVIAPYLIRVPAWAWIDDQKPVPVRGEPPWRLVFGGGFQVPGNPTCYPLAWTWHPESWQVERRYFASRGELVSFARSGAQQPPNGRFEEDLPDEVSSVTLAITLGPGLLDGVAIPKRGTLGPCGGTPQFALLVGQRLLSIPTIPGGAAPARDAEKLTISQTSRQQFHDIVKSGDPSLKRGILKVPAFRTIYGESETVAGSVEIDVTPKDWAEWDAAVALSGQLARDTLGNALALWTIADPPIPQDDLTFFCRLLEPVKTSSAANSGCRKYVR